MPNKDVSLSNQIYKSRDQIRDQIIEYMRSYLELENVDLTKSTFLSFMVNTLSTLTSNLIFYQSSIYREFFLTKAQLSESIYALSTFLGYNVKKASYASVDLLFTLPLEFESSEISFTIPNGFKAFTGNIEFRTYYSTVITITNNSLVEVQIIEDNRSYNIPVEISQEDNECYFLLPVNQTTKNEQEFQIDDDIQQFQFINIDVPLESELSDISVFVRSPQNSYLQPYDEYSSLFLIGPDERGFVQRKTDEGIRIYFGNGLIGYQPEPGSTVIVETTETSGEDGNVIPGSIKNGDRIYVTDNNERQILNYSITNPVAASGGKDEESVEEIRSNAIANLTSMDRLVSNDDYDNFETIIDNDIFNSAVPVLKRSDLKINEIQIYTILNQGQTLIPTRNETYDTTELYIPRDTKITLDGKEYLTLFDIYIDPINRFGSYYYFIDEITSIPELENTFDIDTDCSFIINDYNIKRDGDNCDITINYYVDEDTCSEYFNLSCKIELLEVQQSFQTTNDPVNKTFTISIPFDDLPVSNISLLFKTYLEDDLFKVYSGNVIFKEDLSSSMSSNVTIDTTGTIDVYTVYDIPVIYSSYFTEVDRKDFERTVLQQLVGLNLEEKRMLTDFLNVKLANTIGKITNMLKNKTESEDVISIVDELPTTGLTVGDRYIYDPTGEVIVYQGDGEWTYNTVSNNSIVYVENLGYKVIFNGRKWFKPVYDIPLNISIEAFVEDRILGSEAGLVQTIKDTLYDEFSSNFGPQFELYKSEIINVVHNIDGVRYCHVTKPESDIFFNYSTDNFTQDELLEYTPELVYFTKDSITVRIFRG